MDGDSVTRRVRLCLDASTFNTVAEGVAGAAPATSPVTMAYVTTETGAATMIIMVLIAGFLLIRRSGDFNPAPHHPAAASAELVADGHQPDQLRA